VLHFTEREIMTIRLLADGKTNDEIAQKLFISVHTVKKNIENIFEKTNLHNRVQIAVYAYKNGLIE
jgi:NarL family two-component system response regulator LiaR